MNTQLTSAINYNTNNMVFSKPMSGKTTTNLPPTYRIQINTRNADNTIGELIITTSTIFSYGVQENKAFGSEKMDGYKMPLCMWSKEGATVEEKAFTDTLNNIVDKCKEHLVDHRDEFEKYDLEVTDLKKLNPLWWKKEQGKVVQGVGPVLYAKLGKKKDYITTIFYDVETGEELQPLDILEKYCFARAAVKIESIFIGSNISLQLKLHEVEVRLLDQGPKRLLRATSVKSTPVLYENQPTEQDDFSVSESEEEDFVKPTFDIPKKKVVSKRSVGTRK